MAIRPTERPVSGGGYDRADGIAIAVFLVVTVIVAWNRFSYDLWLSRHDLLTFFLPWYAFLGERLRAFDIPGWNPHLFSGIPFAGDPESGWMYLPAMLFFPLLPVLSAFKAMVAFQLVVAGLSVYAFARVLGMGAIASLVGTTVFTFGPFLYHNTYCCTVRAQLAAWLPLALLGVELALRAGRWRDRIVPWFLSGFAISQMFAGWLGQGIVNGLLVVAAYVLYRAVLSAPAANRGARDRLTTGAATGVTILVLGLALGAAGILPRLVVNQQTNLSGGNYEELGEGAKATPYTFDILLHHIIGEGYDHRAVAVGGTALVLALLAPLVAGRRFGVPFFAGLTLIVFTLTQETTPLHRLFYLIPRFQQLHEHSPHQVNTVVMIGPAILSAAAVAALERWRGQWRRLPLIGLPFLLVTIAAVRLDQVDRFVGWPPLIAVTLVTILIALVVAIPRQHGATTVLGRVAHLAPVLILGIALVQPTGLEIIESVTGQPRDPTWRTFWLPNPRYEQAIVANVAETDPGGAGEFLQERQAEQGPFRHVGYGGLGHPDDPYGGGNYQSRRMIPAVQALLVSGRPIFLDLYEIQGYDPIQLRRYVEFMAALNKREQDYHVSDLLPSGVTSPLLNMLNVRYIVVDASLPPDRDDIAALSRGRREVFRNEEVIVYENARTLPRAWIVYDVRWAERGAAAPLFASGKIDPRRIAYIEEPPPPLAERDDPSQATARVTRYEPDAMTIATETAAPGFLVVSEVYERGWRGYVDGEPTEVLPTNHALRGMWIPAGEHQVELRYEPGSLRLGLWLSGISTGAMLVVFAVAGWSRLKRTLTRRADTSTDHVMTT